MSYLVLIAQVIVAFSVYFVWIFRFFNVEKEFKLFQLSDVTRSFIGAIKISLAAVLLVSIWHSELLLFASVLMGLLMIGAQYFHFKAKNPIIKHLPSLVLLLLCAFLTLTSLGTF